MTDYRYKGDFAIREKIVLHYDDCDEHLESCWSAGITVVDSKRTSVYKKFKGEDYESCIR